ncbi:urease subunit beta [Ornithinimicrobium cavernae]|uniref:urease subunit beta n=1 Tax=Ornithinimicrobium cavernae TaxID=2666047 RepID=UPI000D68FD1E|nr:urease subunit beta [Ornithinimicrobium cavernae]
MIPGEVRVGAEPLDLNTGRDRQTLVMVNEGDRPIQVGSHLHLPAANPALGFDRVAAEGYRLDIPSGTSVRFEPGVSRTVEIVALAGRKVVPGLQVRQPDDLPSHHREPKPVVPFGTPGTEVETPQRASGYQVRVSEEPTQAEAGASESGQETP